MEKLIQVIENYIKSDDSYALQIDGDWGTGKTYFIKENIIPKLKEQKYFPVYFSLYGYSDLSDIKHELLYKIISVASENKLLSSYQTVKDKFNGVSETLDDARIKSVGLVIDWLAQGYQKNVIKKDVEGKNLVIFLDDLERISSNVHTTDLLGFVLNDLLENLKYKVIIISNAAEIKSNEGFEKIREKVINRTIHFSYDGHAIGELILKKSKNKFIREEQEWIMNIIEDYLHNEENRGVNLRTIFFIISSYDFIENSLRGEIENLDSDNLKIKIRKSIFLNIFVITNEYKNGNITKDNFKYLSRLNDNRYFSYYLSEGEEKKISEVIIDRYHKKNAQFDEYIMYNNAINSYVFSGLFNGSGYVEAWKNLFIISLQEIGNFHKLMEFRRYTDNELRNIQQNLINDIDNDIFSFNDLLKVYERFLQFEEMDLIFICDSYSEKIEYKLIEKYKEMDSSIDLKENLLLTGLSHLSSKLEEVLIKLEPISKEKMKYQSLSLVHAIFENDYVKLSELKNSIGIFKLNIFETLMEEELIEKYVTAENNKADLLDFYIRAEYLQIINAKEFHEQELADIKNLLQKVKTKLQTLKLGRIDTFKINELINTLDKLIAHLS